MSPVEWIAVGLSVLVLAETAWLILAPGSVVSLSKSVARHPYKLMALYSVLSLVFLYWLLGSMSLM